MVRYIKTHYTYDDIFSMSKLTAKRTDSSVTGKIYGFIYFSEALIGHESESNLLVEQQRQIHHKLHLVYLSHKMVQKQLNCKIG